MSRTLRSIRLQDAARRERAAAARIAHADTLVRVIGEALDTAHPLRASAARVAVDELRAMVSTLDVDVLAPSLSTADSGQISASDADNARPLERLARAAALPEVEDLDFRRGNGQGMTEPELLAWRRIERFAALVATAITAGDIELTASLDSIGAGPVAAS